MSPNKYPSPANKESAPIRALKAAGRIADMLSEQVVSYDPSKTELAQRFNDSFEPPKALIEDSSVTNMEKAIRVARAQEPQVRTEQSK